MTEKSGIYAIRHRQSGKSYVGSAGNISKRWHIHRKNLNSSQHKNLHLQAAWVKYGAASFDWIILELTTNLTEREQFWMDTYHCYQNGFNVCPTARSSRGRILSEAERELRRRCLQMARCHNQAPEAKARRVATRRKEKTLGQKVDWQQVCKIREKYGNPSPNGKGRKQRGNGGVTLKALAEEYHVDDVTIFDIVRRKTWKTNPNEHLSPPSSNPNEF